MSTWPENKIGDLINVKHGYAFKSQYFSLNDGRYVVLTPGNFFDGGGFKLRPEKDRYYIGDFPNNYILKKNDVIIAMTEQTYGLLGSPAIIPEDDKYLHNQRLGLVEVKDRTQLFLKYFYHVLKTNLIRDQISIGASGTKIRHTAPEKIYRLSFPLPPLQIQKQIAAVLSAYDDLIEINNRRIENLEQMAEEIYKEWFVRMRFPGHQTAKFIKGIPEGWETLTIGQMIEKKILEKPLDGNHGEKHPKGDDFTDNGIPFIMASDLNNGFVNFDTCKFISKTQADSLQKGFSLKGDVLLTHKATIGRTAIIGKLSTPYIMLTPQVTYYRIKDHSRMNSVFLKNYFDQKGFQELLALWAGSGGTRSYIGITAQQKLPILLPTENVISMFKDKIESLIYQKDVLLLKNNNLKQTRDRLLTRLISGKLSVENLEIQFPPSMKE